MSTLDTHLRYLPLPVSLARHHLKLIGFPWSVQVNAISFAPHELGMNPPLQSPLFSSPAP
jgi:hypothetical protein